MENLVVLEDQEGTWSYSMTGEESLREPHIAFVPELTVPLSGLIKSNVDLVPRVQRHSQEKMA